MTERRGASPANASHHVLPARAETVHWGFSAYAGNLSCQASWGISSQGIGNSRSVRTSIPNSGTSAISESAQLATSGRPSR